MNLNWKNVMNRGAVDFILKPSGKNSSRQSEGFPGIVPAKTANP